MSYNADPVIEQTNLELINNFEFQRLFQNYYYSVDEERARDQLEFEAQAQKS